MAKSFLSCFFKKWREGLKRRGAKSLALLFPQKCFRWFGIASGLDSITSDPYLRVKNGIALCRGPLLTEKNALIETHYYPIDGKKAQDDDVYVASFSRFFPKIRRVKKTVISLACPWQDAFYHWVYEVLPRFHFIEKENFVDPYYLIAQNTSFQKESVKLLGIEKEQIVDVKGVDAIQAPLILGFENPTLASDYTLPLLRKKFLPFLTKKEKKKIYISRHDASRRRILNEEALFAELEKRGFEKKVLSPLTFLEQMDLFYNASCIVAPHGAALSHLAFCDRGTQVLEIFSPSYHHECYKKIAEVQHLSYASLFGEGGIVYKSDPDIIVDVNKVISLL